MTIKFLDITIEPQIGDEVASKSIVNNLRRDIEKKTELSAQLVSKNETSEDGGKSVDAIFDILVQLDVNTIVTVTGTLVIPMSSVIQAWVERAKKRSITLTYKDKSLILNEMNVEDTEDLVKTWLQNFIP